MTSILTFLILAEYCFIAIFSTEDSNPKNDFISISAVCSKHVQLGFSGWTYDNHVNKGHKKGHWNYSMEEWTHSVLTGFKNGNPARKGFIVGSDVQGPIPPVQVILLHKVNIIHSHHLKAENK